MEIFARVVDGKIVEYPVMKTHIENRGHPINWYVLCKVAEKPATDELSYARQKVVLDTNGGVTVTWSVESYGLDALLSRLPSNEPERNRRPEPKKADPSAALINRIKELTTQRVQETLDGFAGTRGYGTPVGGAGALESAITYIGDTNASWDADGTYCKTIRSAMWTALFAYFTDVVATPQVQPWPNSWKDIAVKLPVPVWPV
jgi:hypothetical protein